MQSINPSDHNIAQVENIDTLVSEIREITDHIHQHGPQDLSSDPRNGAGDYQRPSQTPQNQFYQPRHEYQEQFPQDQARDIDRNDDTSRQKQRPPINPTDVSKGLSKLHARVDEVLRKTPLAKRRLDTSGSYDVDNTTSFHQLPSGNKDKSARPNLLPEENYRPSQNSTASYLTLPKASIPSASKPERLVDFATVPAYMPITASSTSTSPITQQQQQQQQMIARPNPFSENMFSRAGEYDSRKPSLQSVSTYGQTMVNQVGSSPMLNAGQSETNPDFYKSQKEDRPFRSPSMLETVIANNLTNNMAPYAASLMDMRNDQSQARIREFPSASMIMSSQEANINISRENPQNPMYSSSVPSFKPRYDKSKLDQIISNIRQRDGNGPRFQAPPAADYASQGQGQQNKSMNSGTNFYQRSQEYVPQYSDYKRNENQRFFSIDATNNLKQNIPESLQQEKLAFLSPYRDMVQNNFQQYNSASTSKIISPGKSFQSPQNMIPSTHAYYPSNPFNQPRPEVQEEEEQHQDYYGLLRAQQEPEREREMEREQRPTQYGLKKYITPNKDLVDPRASLYQYGRDHQQTSARISDYEREAYPKARNQQVPEERYERYMGSQERFERYEENPGWYDREERAQREERPQRQMRGVREEEYTRKMEQPKEMRTGTKRKLGPRVLRDEDEEEQEYQQEEDFFCGEIENDDDSLLEDHRPRKERRVHPAGRSNKQETANFFCGGLEDDESESSMVENHNDRHYRPQQRSNKKDIRARGEQFVEKLPPRNMIPLPRQEPARRQPEKLTRRQARSNSRRRNSETEELVFLNKNQPEEMNLKKSAQPIGQEHRKGGSVPRRASKERDLISRPDNSRDLIAKQNTSMRNSRAPVEEDRGSRMLGIGSSETKNPNPKKFLNNEDELSDFDFEANRFGAESPEAGHRGRRNMSKQARRDEDSVTRTFEHARTDQSGRKSAANRDGGVSHKTEMIFNTNPSRRKVFR